MDGDQTGAGYSGHDRQRWVREPPKRRARTAFERDRARVLHSAALRRLAAKTQVVEPGVVTGENQHSPRTRLTHSLECAQIGRELGKVFGCDPDLVEAACLAHDLGHPPFGHNGEVALDTVAEPCGGFEGNAQSLRILTRLEPKAFAGAADAADLDRADRSAGLNLTRATLDACIKYPWFRDDSPIPGKYGVYPDDAPVFHWIREGAPPRRPCFEAQVMDWADDVAYSVHDLEDAVHAGYVGLDQLSDPGEVREVCELAARTYCEASVDELVETFARLRAQSFWPERYDGTARALAALKDLTSELIGRFCQAAEEATIAAFGPGPMRRYAADLIVPRPQRLECALLKAVAARYVMHREGHGARRARQRELVIELTELLSRGAPDTLDPAFRAAFHAARDDVSRLRVVIDQAASLTDTSAVAWHRRLTGR